jgi:hypothetical protein
MELQMQSVVSAALSCEERYRLLLDPGTHHSLWLYIARSGLRTQGIPRERGNDELGRLLEAVLMSERVCSPLVCRSIVSDLARVPALGLPGAHAALRRFCHRAALGEDELDLLSRGLDWRTFLVVLACYVGGRSGDPSDVARGARRFARVYVGPARSLVDESALLFAADLLVESYPVPLDQVFEDILVATRCTRPGGSLALLSLLRYAAVEHPVIDWHAQELLSRTRRRAAFERPYMALLRNPVVSDSVVEAELAALPYAEASRLLQDPVVRMRASGVLAAAL